MKKETNRRKRDIRHSLKLKTSLIVAAVILLSVTLCGWLLIGIVEKKLKQETIHSAGLNAELIVRHLDDQLNYMEQAYYGVLFDAQIQRWLLHPEEDTFYQGIRQKTDTLIMASNYNVYSIYIKNFLDDRIYTTDFMTWQSSNGYGGVPQEGSYSAPELCLTNSFSSSGSIRLVSLAGQIRQNDFGDPLAWVSVNVQAASIASILREDSDSEQSPLLLADENGAVIATGRAAFPEDLVAPALAANTGDIVEYAGERYLAIAAQTGKYQWQYRRLLPESQIFSEVYYLGTVLFAILVIFTSIVFLSLYQVLNYITNPIYDLSNLVRSYQQSRQNGRWIGSFHTERRDEFAFLYQSLQEMTERIDRLIDQEYKAQLYKKETQLRIYRNGVNPHFLYNILDSLLWTIKFGEYKRAEQILQDFSVFLHHVLRTNREFVTVQSCEEELRTFCELSSFLKDDSIAWSIQFEPETLSWVIPSFFVQPIVENCFKHAFNGRDEGGLQITAEIEDSALVFSVQDNGVGMEEAQRQALVEYLDTYDFNKDDAHFGLASVHQRLKLYYGEEYGLRIQTKKGVGTAITFRLPLDKLAHQDEIE